MYVRMYICVCKYKYTERRLMQVALQAELEAARAAPLLAKAKGKGGKGNDSEQTFAPPMGGGTRKGTLTSDETQAKILEKILESVCAGESMSCAPALTSEN